MTPDPNQGIAIIAGSGDLPRLLAEDQRSLGSDYLVVSFVGQTQDWVSDHPSFSAQFEKAGALFDAIKSAGCDRVVFAGGMVRPRLNPLKFDKQFLKLATYLLPALKGGDDKTLGAVARAFQDQGLKIVPAEDLLDNLLAQGGCETKHHPSDADIADIERGFDILDVISSADIGQAAVISDGVCLGVETIGGTNFLLSTVSQLQPELRAQTPNGVLCKAPKRDQDRRYDLPTIGVETVVAAHRAGLSGIAVKHGGALIIDQVNTVQRADELGLFLWVAK